MTFIEILVISRKKFLTAW